MTSDASATAYDSGRWENGSNDGFGFLPWVLITTRADDGGFVIGSSTENGAAVDSNGDGDIDTAGRAWGLKAKNGHEVTAVRSLITPIEKGGSLSFAFDNGFLYEQGSRDLFQIVSANGGAISVSLREGTDVYIVKDLDDTRPTGVSVTEEGLYVEVNILPAGAYEMAITKLVDGTTSVITGNIWTGESAVGKIFFENRFAGPERARNLYVNSLEACYPDDDGDAVANYADICPDTAIPESVPTSELKDGRWALVDGDLQFDTAIAAGGQTYSTSDTGGCSCEQIISEAGLGAGHTKFGCSGEEMENWISSVNGLAKRSLADVEQVQPEDFILSDVYPNPFNPEAHFTLRLATTQHVVIRVFDVLGREISTLHDGIIEAQQIETFTLKGGSLPSGPYLVSALGESFRATKPVVLLK